MEYLPKSPSIIQRGFRVLRKDFCQSISFTVFEVLDFPQFGLISSLSEKVLLNNSLGLSILIEVARELNQHHQSGRSDS
jgi:hypothetical protein